MKSYTDRSDESADAEDGAALKRSRELQRSLKKSKKEKKRRDGSVDELDGDGARRELKAAQDLVMPRRSMPVATCLSALLERMAGCKVTLFAPESWSQ